MPRFIDHLLAEKTWHVNWMGLPPWMFAGGEVLVERVARTRRVLHESNVVLIDNVAEYYFSHHVDAKPWPRWAGAVPAIGPAISDGILRVHAPSLDVRHAVH